MRGLTSRRQPVVRLSIFLHEAMLHSQPRHLMGKGWDDDNDDELFWNV